MKLPSLPAVDAASAVYYAAAAIACLLLLWAAWWAFVIRPAHLEEQAVRSKVDATFAQARTDSAVEANTVTSGAATGAAADETTSRTNHDAITSQPGAQAPVDPHVADAGRRAICMRHAARCSATCVGMLGPCP